MSNRQAGWTAANYHNVRIYYGIRVKTTQISDLQVSFSDAAYSLYKTNTAGAPEQARKKDA